MWLEASGLGQAMRGAGVWAYGVTNLVHILGVATLFAAAVAFLPLPTYQDSTCGPGDSSVSPVSVVRDPDIVNRGTDPRVPMSWRAELRAFCLDEAGKRLRVSGAAIAVAAACAWLLLSGIAGRLSWPEARAFGRAPSARRRPSPDRPRSD